MIKRILQLCSLFSLLGLFAACGGQELDVPVSSVNISRPSAELFIGETVQITATVIPSDATNKTILWSSANPSVATVSGDGLITAVAEGSTEITASAGGKKASCKVTVSKKKVEVSSVELNKTELSLVKGESETLTATIKPDDATNKTIIWDSRDVSVAEVDGDGKVTALGGGTTVITALVGIKMASCTVTVTVPVESISLDQTSVTLEEKESITLIATVGPTDATDKTVTWSSSNSEIAMVQDGRVTAIKEGSATISAKAGDKTATCSVTVKKSVIPVESISLDRTSLELISGESERLTATVKPDNATDKTVTWTSSDTSIVDVDQNGEVRANDAGTAVITARAGEKSATCTVTVKKSVIPVESISLNKTSLVLICRESEILTATVKPDNATDKTVTWTSSDTSIVDVDQNGEVRANDAGTAVITARAGEKSATCTVTVTVPVDKITLDRTSATLKVNESITLTATIKPSNATDKTITWSSSNPNIAKVDNGTVTAINEGTATITAKAGEKSATCTITVEKPEEPDNPDNPEKPSATGIVVTRPATGVTSTEATLNGYFYDATGIIGEAGFYYGTSFSVLTQTVEIDPPSGASGDLQTTLSSLEPGTTYYFRAYIMEYDAAQGKFVESRGSVVSFTTEVSAPSGGPGYLGCFEIPAVKNLDGTGNSGDKYGKWWSYGTTNSLQKVVTHTFVYEGKQYRNYTVLVDGSKKAPLWIAHVMHTDGYYVKNIKRTDKWDYDPAVPNSWQQTGVSGYSKGHFVASSDRLVSKEANYQTFFYTNQAPQYQNSFNDGVWSSLETAIQGNTPSNSDTLYVVTGVLYEGSKKVSGVPIPSHFYKCLMKCSFDSSGNITAANGAAYLFENRAYGKNADYQENRTTIDAVEARSGFDFFANVPAVLQNAAESSSKSIW